MMLGNGALNIIDAASGSKTRLKSVNISIPTVAFEPSMKKNKEYYLTQIDVEISALKD